MVFRDVLRILHQKRDLSVRAADRHMRAAPGALLGAARARNRIMQHGQNVGDALIADALEKLLQPPTAFPLGGKRLEHVDAKKALALPAGHLEIGLVHRDDVEIRVHDHRRDGQAIEDSLEIHAVDDFTKNHEQWAMAADKAWRQEGVSSVERLFFDQATPNCPRGRATHAKGIVCGD